MDTTTLLLGSIAVLLLIVLVLLIAVLVRQKHQRPEVAQQLNQLGNQLLDELDAQRDDSVNTLRMGNDSLMSTLSAMGQNQAALLESMQRQVLLSTRNQEAQGSQLTSAVAQGMTQLDTRLSQLDTRMEQLRQSAQSGMTTLRQENERQLTEMRKTVDEKLTDTLNKRLNASFAQVSERLEQVYKGLGEMQTLAVGVGDLKKVLTNVKTRGIWGEMQLGTLLDEMLTPAQFDRNVAVVPGSTERVEFAVRLPGKEQGVVYLPIDSKFPQEDYIRLVDATQVGDAAAVDAARKALMLRLKTEAKRISSKYIVPPHTTDFAVMFLPIEGLYAEVVRDMDIMDTIQREQRVVVAGPSTFSALLNSLQMGFRTIAIEQRTSEVWQLLGAVKNDFSQFAEVLEKTQQRLRQASDSIDTAFTRTRSIQKRLNALSDEDIAALSDGQDKP